MKKALITDGTPRKLMDTSKLNNLGWNKYRPIADGLSQTYHDWLAGQR